MRKTTALRQLITSNETAYILEAHNGLSAKIVEEAGFPAIWASGLSMSAALGVRDCNEASWTQILEVAEFMSDASKIPILLDGDTGFGNFNNARRLVQKLEARKIAGVVIEDKIFPKTNSFLSETHQTLEKKEVFAGKIKAIKDHLLDDDFVVVARTESLIAGKSIREALDRAEIYRQAGADAILIHSKSDSFDQVEAFSKEWGERLPLVIVPTTYYQTEPQIFESHKISMVIWANHILRSSINAMQLAAQQIYQDKSVTPVHSNIATISEVFRLQDTQSLTADCYEQERFQRKLIEDNAVKARKSELVS